MTVQCEQEGGEHIALGDSCIEQLSRGGVTANLNCLGSVFEVFQYPFAECVTQVQSG